MPAGGGKMLVVLPEDGDEYGRVAGSFFESLPPGFRIISISRNQDTARWVQYSAQKLGMEERADGIGANEQLLFHGTSAERPWVNVVNAG